MTSRLLLLAVSAAALSACSMASNDANQANAARPAQGTGAGIALGSLDKSVKPGDDFYQFANGTWMKQTQIPADRSSVGGFYIADQQRERQTREMLDQILKANPAANTNDGRIAAFYKAYLDTNAIDQAGMRPAQADLAAIAGIADKKALATAIGRTLRADVDPMNATKFQTDNLFGIFVTQGLSTPGETLPYILQGGLGMPEREYYLSADPKMAALRPQYRNYIETVMKAAGAADPKASADRIMALETKIAQAHATREESEDFTKGAGVWTRAELEQKAPGLDWGALLEAAQLGGAQKFEAYHAGAIPKLAALVGSEPLESWKDWLAFHTLNQQASVLPKPIRDANFAFFGTALNGTPQQLSRDRLALNAVSSQLQDAVGKAYVDRYFPASAKAEVQQMVTNIKAAFAKRVQAIDWMAPSTKQEALKKVETIVVGVGYPDSWRDYGSLNLGASAYDNLNQTRLAEYRHQIGKIGKPMDRSEWWMPPQLVNAVNLPVQNALNFPAAILQKPFFDPSADAAFNYGAIGSVIGHEISHSFDNNGAMFDSTGAMRNWWTPQDFARFSAAGQALAKQYDGYEALPGLHVNGKLTLGENIADVSGLAAAYDAYHASLAGKVAPVIDGYSGDQRFFIAYAQSWATKMRPEALRGRIATDGHAPGQFRALTVRNIDPWYSAFAVQQGQKLYLAPNQRVKIW
ncbi:M13 family metallopeptidase [Sphingomonas sp. KRR8]|uniref:M13 family metallopeptidase n=1 Tax=Sphingomonas sp. KRR8 TaxID=2942996 RepID=UPI00202248DB|nr:M13 family metallopeptidase [Sphingomonas sp. KRR8]URD62231.1 M13 family metallopeptidase [Sphingomonas sp. KRR8]